ncbi:MULTISPECIES: sugar porter family MFS transporter [Rhodococcus]|uniref:Sugar porter family MFS transporter n=1 Tax=Rhodococcus jostii TaxID=132919 RepID=A0ABU4CFR1_RHOJO|nr:MULTISPECIES: sugar porter family MFS transporter [Rhodococcus]MDI9948958.1 sugar porter family MFS transporter [Rhodococcus sp. IEGM 1305]MDI9978134.1 sugar porter family MFS transporter [Rhodococcus sp. IEGM 1307]MDV6282098.1 sugar porter family MFS transporter [Rhodococcus jostii]UOT04176.1 sugar porter family MFS transporter [Rhodococcus opacus]
MKPIVVRSAIVAATGGLLFGFDTAVISGAEEQIQQVFALSDAKLGFTVTTALIGTILGALVAGRPADRYGRKKALYVIGVLFVLGALGSALAPNVEILMLFRFIGGIGVGGASVCAPIYTAEIAPAANRGRLVGLVQFNIVLGILIAYASNAVIRAAVPGDNAWRWMLGVMIVPALVFVLMLPTVPETPRWLAANGRWDDATATSKRLCATQADVDFQMSEIRESLAATANMTKVPFFTRGHRKVILLAVAIAVFNQLSGINAVLYYAPRVMQEAGASTNAAFLMSVGVGAMNLVATMVGLSLIDRLGRRKLMIVGSIGYLMSLGFLAAVMFYYENARGGEFTSTSSILVLIGLMGFIAAHAVGQGSVIWVFLSEIFPNRIRGQGQSLGSLTHWVFAAITSFAFPPIIGALGAGAAFSIFFLAMVGQLIWVLKAMPETKGVPLEEMQAKLGVALDHGPDQPTAVRAH